MPKLPVVTQDGKKVGEENLSSDIFDVKVNVSLIEKVVRAFLSNKRSAIAHTKTRAEVSGGGIKPWKQKGTGRARHGSNRSPIWRKGGITFGPRNERNFEMKINKKEKKKALFMGLSSKVSQSQLILLDHLDLKDPKTSAAAQILKNLELEGKKVLVVLPEKGEAVEKSFRNIERSKVVNAQKLTVYDVVHFTHCVMPVESVKAIEKHFLAK